MRRSVADTAARRGGVYSDVMSNLDSRMHIFRYGLAMWGKAAQGIGGPAGTGTSNGESVIDMTPAMLEIDSAVARLIHEPGGRDLQSIIKRHYLRGETVREITAASRMLEWEVRARLLRAEERCFVLWDENRDLTQLKTVYLDNARAKE